MMTSTKRLRKELDSLKSSSDPTIQLTVNGENIREWTAVIRGPDGSPYENHLFELSILAPSDYPMTAPTIKFRTKCFHPNVHFETGEICLDILKSEWSPAWSLQSACRAIIALLEAPAADSPLNCDAGNMIRAGDMVAFRSMATMYCIDKAKPAPLPQNSSSSSSGNKE